MKKLNINRGDVSVYVTFTLLGAGVGLLLGSIIAARIEEKRARDFNNDEDNTLKEVANAVTQRSAERDEEEESGFDKSTESDDASSRSKSSGRGGTGATEENLEKEEVFEERLAALKANYVVTPEQEQDVRIGEVTLTELEKDLYLSDRDRINFAVKPDLDDLVDIDDSEARFDIRASDPREDPDLNIKKITRLLWNPDDDTLVRVVGNRNVPIDDVDGTIGVGTIDTVVELIMFQSITPVYIYDSEIERAYSVEIKSVK